jgi:hypothetical protein
VLLEYVHLRHILAIRSVKGLTDVSRPM